MSWKKSVAFIIVTLGLMAAFRAAAPAMRHRQSVRTVDRLLQEDAFFQGLVTDAPEIRPPLREALIRAYDSGRSHEVRKVGSAFLPTLLPRYVARSSDEALVAFGRNLVASLEDLAARDPTECYRSLFPEVDGPPQGVMTAKQDAMANAMRAVVASARAPEAREKEPDREGLKSILRVLGTRDPDLLRLIVEPDAASADRGRACAAYIEVYREAVARPEAQAAGALRAVFSGT